MTDRRRFSLATAAGGLAALVLFSWLLTVGSFELVRDEQLGGLYDAQAHSLLEGRWDVPAEEASLERFDIDGRSYIYFGPVPAVLRLPIAAVTDHLDDRLSTLSMTLAQVVLTAFLGRLSWGVRSLARPGASVGRREAVLVGILTFTLATSTPLFLASRAWVYHEASLWGVALAMAAFDQLLRHQLRGGAGRLVATSALAAGALLARPAVGGGPIAALAMLAGLGLAARLGVLAHSVVRGRWWALALAPALGLGLSASVNLAKFDRPVGIPLDRHAQSTYDEARQAFLAANDGSLFGPQFVPTTATHYLRPDALGVDRLMPWVTFPERATVVGDVTFDLVDRSSSVPASMPGLVVLALGGAVAVLRRSGPLGPFGARVLRVCILGAGAGFGVVLVTGYVANRYLADAFPLVAVPALVGAHLGLARARSGWATNDRRRRVLVLGATGIVAVLALAGTWINLSLGLWYQRVYRPPLEAENPTTDFVATRFHVDELLAGGAVPDLGTGSVLPPPTPEGRLFAVDGCAGLYLSIGDRWRPVERTPATGSFELEVEMEAGTEGRQPLVSLGTGPERLDVALRPTAPGRAVIEQRNGTGAWRASESFAFGGGAHDVRVVADRRAQQYDVWVDGVWVHEAFVGIPEPEPLVVGGRGGEGTGAGGETGGLAATFSGDIRLRPGDPSLCRALVARR